MKTLPNPLGRRLLGSLLLVALLAVPASAQRGKKDAGTLRLVPLFPAPVDAPAITAGKLKSHLPRYGKARLKELGRYDPVPDLEAAPLDIDGTRWLFRYQWGAVEATVFVTTSEGKILGAESFTERTPEVNLVDLVADPGREVIVSVIDGTALSDWPKEWQIFQLKRGRKFHKIGTIPVEHVSGAKDPLTHWQNRITAPERGILRVETTRFQDRGERPSQEAPTDKGLVRTWTFQKKKGRYVEDPVSRKAQQAAHKAWKRASRGR